MKVLVVDDEPLARRRLCRMLAKLRVEVGGEAADGAEALALVARERFDALLLDIRMPGMDGLALAASSDELPPIVFTTAYDEHAVRAFEVSAVDYLLKPVKLERLRAALDKVARAPAAALPALRVLLERVARPEIKPLAARAGTTVRLLDPRGVARIRAEDKYALVRDEGRDYLLDESLRALEERLAPLGFLRVHRAELVNLARVRALHVEDDAPSLELDDGQRVPVSRRLAPELRRRLGLR